MATKTKFMTTAFLKLNSSIENNTDDSLLNPLILKAQQTYLIEDLGTDLYDKLTSDINAYVGSGTPIPTAYKTLLDEYVRPALLQWTTYEAIPFMNVRLTNIGTVNKTSDNSTGADVDSISIMKKNIRNFADTKSKDLILFLMENSTDYPEFDTNTGLDKTKPRESRFFQGMYMGNGGRKCNRYQ